MHESIVLCMGPDKKKFKTTCHLTFLEKKIVRPTTYKRSIPPLNAQHLVVTLYIYEIESLFFINFYLQLFNYNRIINLSYYYVL